MLSKIFKPQYMRMIKQPSRGFADKQTFGFGQSEESEKQEQKKAEQQQEPDQQQHYDEFKDDEEDFQDKQQKESSPIGRSSKWLAFFGVSYLFWLNGKIAIDCEDDDELASQQTFYIAPIYAMSKPLSKPVYQVYEYLLYPPMKKFLPDELPLNPKLMRKTLVLNFEGTMYSKDMKTGDGLVLHLRPGFRKFLKQMSQKYEIVIFSKEDMNFLSEVIKTIDPHQMFFPFFFGNEFLAQQVNGKMLKDLNYLNRSQKRTVVVDFDDKIYKNANYNILYLEKYQGEENDQGLKKLSFFLEHLSKPNISDVRREIKKYGGFQEAVDNYKQRMDEKYQKVKNNNSFFTKKFIGINKKQL